MKDDKLRNKLPIIYLADMRSHSFKILVIGLLFGFAAFCIYQRWVYLHQLPLGRWQTTDGGAILQFSRDQTIIFSDTRAGGNIQFDGKAHFIGWHRMMIVRGKSMRGPISFTLSASGDELTWKFPDSDLLGDTYKKVKE